MSGLEIWGRDGKPIYVADPKEAKRLARREEIIDKVLKEMGYEDGYARFEEYVNEITSTDPQKYLELLKRVDELEGQPEPENEKGGV